MFDDLTVCTPLPRYLPFPKFLLDAQLSHTAKLLYALLLDRATLSRKNNWTDEQGRIHVVYPIPKLAQTLGCSFSSITRSLTELTNAGLIERTRSGFSKPSRIFLKIPHTAQKCAATLRTSGSSDCAEMTNMIVQKCPPNYLNMNELNSSFSGRNDIVDKLCRYPLLIIDDFGMERGTEYALEQVYNIVDSRYRSQKPLIVTTNLPLDEIRHPQDTAHARIYDRILEMCVPISCIGASLRKENAQKKLESMKSLIG